MAKKIENKIKALKKDISSKFNSMHQAASIALEIYLISLKIEDIKIVEELKTCYLECIKRSDMAIVLENQIEYAIRIAIHDSELIYEEMHKLFSLCEEIEALKMLGLKTSSEQSEKLDNSLKHRFTLQPKMAKTAAINNVEEWSKGYWWYAENVGKSGG